MSAYLDNAATTPMRPEAVDAMQPFMAERFANPSGAHAMARDARRAVDDAREVMAEVLGAAPGEVIFTGGGTEADNLAVFGVHGRRAGTVVCSAIEHHAVLEPVESLDGRLVAVDARGLVDLDAFEAALDAEVSIVSVLAANNEVGTIQPLAELAEIMRRRAPEAVFHTDAIQAFSWLDVADLAAPVDLISISAHKFGGPKGVGVLVARRGVELKPLLLGGGQERDRRSGTQNVAGIAGMAAAAQVTVETRKANVDRLRPLRDRLVDGLVASVPDTIETGQPTGAVDRSTRIAGTAHVCFEGVESEALLFLLEKQGVYASAASSCASGAMDPSHVLAAMGVPRSVARGSLRLSLGFASTVDDVDLALEVIPPAVARLREYASRWN